MASYHQVDDCGLTACAPGSTPGPKIGIEYRKLLLFSPVFVFSMVVGEFLEESSGFDLTYFIVHTAVNFAV